MKLLFWARWLLRSVRDAIWLTVDWAAFSISDRHKDGRVLLLVRVDAIGDFVLWINSAKTIRNHFVDRQIILVCNKVCADLAIATNLFDKVHGVDLKCFSWNLRYRWQVIRQVAQLGASVAIQPTFSRVLLTGDALIRVSSATERIGSVGDLANRCHWHKRVGDCWYTTLVPAITHPMMELERNTEFLRGLGIDQAKPAVAQMPINENLSSAKLISNSYFVIFPGASTVGRMWPAKAFAEVADTVHDLYGWQPVICGSKAERAIAANVIKYSHHSKWGNFTGTTTLPEFVEILRRAQFVVANETSAVHIAASVATPSICILGGGHFGRFMPYTDAVSGIKPVAVHHRMDCFGCNWRCCYANNGRSLPYPCIEAVQVEDVIDKLKKAVK